MYAYFYFNQHFIYKTLSASMVVTNMLNANFNAVEAITNQFNHKDNANKFAAKNSPKKAKLQEFVEDPNADYCYTYAYKNEVVTTVLKKLRHNAKKIGLSADIFLRDKNNEIKYIKISKLDHAKWKQLISVDYGSGMSARKREFKFDDEKGIFFTNSSENEKPFKVAFSIRRHLLKKYNKDVVINEKSVPPRVEISKEAYEALMSKEKIVVKTSGSKEKPKKSIPLREREFIFDDKSEHFYVFPYKGEDIGVIHGVFKEGAKAKNLDPAIFEITHYKGKQACKISKENYKKWQERVKVRTKKVYAIRRSILRDNNSFYFQSFDGEFSGKVLSSLNRYCKLHNLSELVKEFRNDFDSNRVYITPAGKRKWEEHLSTLDGATFRYPSNKHPKSAAKSQSASRIRSIDDNHTFIAKKYLQDAVSVPFATKNTEVTPIVTNSVEMPFYSLKSLLLSQSTPLKERKLVVKNDGKHFHVRVAFRSGNFTLNQATQHHLFIRAGRKLAAQIPTFTAEQNQCTIYLMMSNNEFQEANEEVKGFYNRLPENMQLIIIGSVFDDQKRLPANEARTSNVKRMVSLLLAKHYEISDYVLLDDNISQFAVSAAIIDAITPKKFFDLFRNSANQTIYSDKQKPLCITTGINAPYKNIPHRLDATALQPLKPCLGSKLMYIDSKKIIEKAKKAKIPIVNLFSFNHLWWGEDYYWELALMILSKDNISVLGQLPFSVAHVEKDGKNRNVTLDIANFQKANAWLEQVDQLQDDPDLTPFQKQVAVEMSHIVKAELKRREELQQKFGLSKTILNTPHDHELLTVNVDKPTSPVLNTQTVITVQTANIVPVTKILPAPAETPAVAPVKTAQAVKITPTAIIASEAPVAISTTTFSTISVSAAVQPETAIELPVVTQNALFCFNIEKAKITGAECGNRIAMLGFPLNDNKLRHQAVKQFGENKNLIHYYIESAKSSHAAIFNNLSAAEIALRQNAFHHKRSTIKI